jgi:glyoxylase-like metal-dependent hydrolase (beta-lactamase superfamily II)
MNDILQPLSDEFEKIYFVKGQRGGRVPFSHSLLIDDHIIDTGISRKHLRALKKEISVNHVIFSHWHEDHVRDNQMLKDVKHSSHPLDKPIIEDARKFMEFYCALNTPMEAFMENYLYDVLKIRDTDINMTFEDDEIIEIGEEYKLKVVHTPGHSAGHCCFLEFNTKVAFLADIDLSSFGPWYGCKDCDVIDFEESIDKLKNLNIEIAVTAHNGLIEGSSEINKKLDDYKSIIFQRDDLILERLSEKNPTTVDDLMRKKIIYHKYNDGFLEFLYVAEKTMLQKHLDKFLKKGTIEPKNNGYVLV